MTIRTEGDVQANGITIHYYRTGGDKKPSILLLHGITDSGLCWPLVARDLAENYDVIMTDARGHGRSGGSGAAFSLELLADDAAALIRALDLAKPFVWGHSMGAITAAMLAATYPDLVRAVVLEDPPLMERRTIQTGEEQAELSAWQWLFDLRALAREERIARGFAVNPNWAREEITPWADSKGEMNIDIMKPALVSMHQTAWREIIARIECPILLVTGDPELHARIPPETAQEAARLWKQGEVLRIHGAGHNIHRDRYAETLSAVQDFLRRT